MRKLLKLWSKEDTWVHKEPPGNDLLLSLFLYLSLRIIKGKNARCLLNER